MVQFLADYVQACKAVSSGNQSGKYSFVSNPKVNNGLH